MTSTVLAILQQQLSTVDDQTLIALANKGLLRRAGKDLESTPPQILAVEETLQMQVGEVVVTMPPNGPTQAQCSCPAVGICRHILTVCLWLRSEAQSQSQAPIHSDPSHDVEQLASLVPDQQLLRFPLQNYSQDQLTHWATKQRIQKATEQLASGILYQITGEEPLQIQFPDLNITCRYFHATGLEGMICSCKATQICLHRVMAVLAYRHQQGEALDLALLASESQRVVEAPRSREEVIAAAQQGLAEAIAVGIVHLSESTRQRWVTLAVSAQGVNLHRLGLALRRLGDQLGLSLQRDAKADEERLFAAMAQTYGLCEALIHAPHRADLVGQSRSQYSDVGHLELVGMGAYTWQSQSGYAGLTLLFWDPTAQNWCTWSEARPQFHHTGFDPSTRYYQAGPWSGVSSPAEAARGRLKLLGAKRNRQRRLSAAKQTQGITLGPTMIDQLQQLPKGKVLFESWGQLRHHLAHALPMGLQEIDPNASLVVIRPADWGERYFDSITQTLLWPLGDPQGQVLMLQVPYRSSDHQRLQALEALDPSTTPVWGVIGRASIREGEIGFYPLSLLVEPKENQSAVIPLSFTSQFSSKSPSGTPQISEPISEDPEGIDPELEEETDPELDVLISPLDRHILLLMDHLQTLAEGGSHRLTEPLINELSRQAQVLQPAGLEILTQSLHSLIRGEQIPHQILKLRYLCQLAREARVKAKLLKSH